MGSREWMHLTTFFGVRGRQQSLRVSSWPDSYVVSEDRPYVYHSECRLGESIGRNPQHDLPAWQSERRIRVLACWGSFIGPSWFVLRTKMKQIHFGNDRQKNKSNSRSFASSRHGLRPV